MGYTAKGCAGTLLSPIWHGAASHHRTHALFAPSGVSAGQDSNVLGRGFNSCYIPQEWQQQVQEPAEQGHGWLMGNLGIAGGKAAWLSALPPQTQPALGPHSPETDKSYRKRGDLSLRLAWLVSAQRGEWSTTQRAGALQLQGLRATLSAACHSPGAQGLLSDAREGTNSPGTSEQPQLRPSVMAICSLMCSWSHHIPSSSAGHLIHTPSPCHCSCSVGSWDGSWVSPGFPGVQPCLVPSITLCTQGRGSSDKGKAGESSPLQRSKK